MHTPGAAVPGAAVACLSNDSAAENSTPARQVHLAAQIELEHLAATRDAIAAMEHAIACGTLLLEAKAQVGHGGWLPWIEANLTFGDRQARKYMRAANHVDQIRHSNSDFTLDNAMAMLAERSTSHTLRVMGSSESNRVVFAKGDRRARCRGARGD